MKKLLPLVGSMFLLTTCDLTVKNDITTDYLVDGLANNKLAVYMQDNQIFRYRGKPEAVTLSLGNQDLSNFEPCFVLHVGTGDTQATTVSSAIIKIEGTVILNTSDFSKNGGKFTFEVCDIIPTSVMSLEVRGEPGSYIDIWIEGKFKIPTEGLVAYYPFNKNANDESGNGYNGTVNGATLTTDRFDNLNSAYNFIQDNYIDMGNILSDVFANNYYTLSCWYNRSEDRNGGILGKWQNCCPNTGNNAFWATPASFCTNSYCSKELPLPPVNSWVHWVAVINSGTLRIYQNGILVNTETGHNSVASDRPLMVSWHQPGSAFVGKIDDIRIYSRALSDSEVQLLYHEGGWQE
jgi:hypothetical protein